MINIDNGTKSGRQEQNVLYKKFELYVMQTNTKTNSPTDVCVKDTTYTCMQGMYDAHVTHNVHVQMYIYTH